MQFAKEHNELSKPISFRSKECMWSTPFDMIYNQIIEELRADKKHGSCGMGIWSTIVRNKNVPFLPLDTFNDLEYPNKVSYLKKIKSYYNNILPDIPSEWLNIWNAQGLIDNFILDCNYMCEYCHTQELTENFASLYDKVIFENGQGLLLNDDGTDNPYKTPSKTGLEISSNIIKDWKAEVDVHYVTRSYLTRHGEDPFFKAIDKADISSSIQEDAFNPYNQFQGIFKYNTLNISNLIDRINQDFGSSKFNKVLDITHLDELDNYSEFLKYSNQFKINAFDTPLVK